MRILVTGGAGFIGANFLLQAMENPKIEKIVVIDSLTYASNKSRIQKHIDSGEIEFIQTDIVDTSKYRRYILESDYIFHFAAETHVDRSITDGSPFIHTNIEGTYKLTEAIMECGNPRTVFVSTDEVYGSIGSGESLESDPINPSSIYSASKASADMIVRSQWRTHGLNGIVTRGSNNYGPGQNTEKFIPMAINAVLLEKPIPVYGNGLQIREWIHVNDHCRAILEIAISGKAGEIYNIGSSLRLTNLEVLDTIGDILEVKISDYIQFVEDRLGHDSRYAINSEKLQKIHNTINQFEFKEGIKNTIDWYRRNGTE